MATRRRRTQRNSQGLEPIGKVIVRASPDQPQQRGSSPFPLWLWEEAVGQRIARRARPLRLERGVLTVRAATSVWAQELSFLAPTIMTQLKALGLAVTSIRFSVGALDSLPNELKPAAMPAPGSEAGRPLGRELSGSISKIDDAGLRGVIARAARENLAWQARGKDASRGATSATPNARDPRSAAPKTSAPARTSPTTPVKSRGRP